MAPAPPVVGRTESTSRVFGKSQAHGQRSVQVNHHLPVLGSSALSYLPGPDSPRPVSTWLRLLVPARAGQPSLSQDWSPQTFSPSLGPILLTPHPFSIPIGPAPFTAVLKWLLGDSLSALTHCGPLQTPGGHEHLCGRPPRGSLGRWRTASWPLPLRQGPLASSGRRNERGRRVRSLLGWGCEKPPETLGLSLSLSPSSACGSFPFR